MGACFDKNNIKENEKELEIMYEKLRHLTYKLDSMDNQIKTKIREDKFKENQVKNITGENLFSLRNNKRQVKSTALIKASNYVTWKTEFKSLSRGVTMNEDISIQKESFKYLVTSTDNEDRINGRGARKLLIAGVNEEWEPIQDIILLNGIEPVETNLIFRGINEMTIIEAGDYDYNIGNIYAKQNGNIYGIIQKEWSNSNLGVHYVQKGLEYIPINYITNNNSSMGNDIIIDVFVKPFGLPRQKLARQEFSTISNYELKAIPNIAEKSIIYFKAKNKYDNKINNIVVWFQFATTIVNKLILN